MDTLGRYAVGEKVKVVPTFGQFSVSVMIFKFSFPFIRPVSSQDSFFAHEHKSP